MMLQQTSPPDWSTYARSCLSDEAGIIRHIMDLHNGGEPFDLDPTYSTGRFYKGLPEPRRKFDLFPQAAGVERASADALPLEAESIKSIMFDPPFVPKDTTNRVPNGIIEMRFSGYAGIPNLWAFYDRALAEFLRVLVDGGLLVFKCQDVIDGGKQHLSHVHIINEAVRLGFYCKDLFVLWRANVLWSPNMKKQQHARKNHSYFLVFVKQS